MGSKKRKIALILILVVSHLFCIGVGVAGTMHVAWKVMHSGVNETFALAFSSEHVRLQMHEGKPEVARAAAQSHLQLLEKFRPNTAPWMYHAERMATLVQLAGLERRHLNDAAADCRQVPQPDCCDASLRKLAAWLKK